MGISVSSLRSKAVLLGRLLSLFIEMWVVFLQGKCPFLQQLTNSDGKQIESMASPLTAW